MTPAECPPEDQLARLVEGGLAQESANELLTHVEHCASCRTAVAALARAISAATDATAPSPAAPAPPREASSRYGRGAELGRWLVLDVLGAGAMGTVYSAYDPQLERKVALKVLHVSGSAEADARLLREAQAMAQVTHPNVVTVHEVFVSPSGPVVVMELVAGATLRAWQQAPGRSTAELLAAYVAAGRGLQAVHDAGLVHRDFKPSNVLVGADGRVRIGDFGLAREEPSREAPLAASTGIATHTGALVGTPAYMSPEQLRGAGRQQGADARSDQFSFAVALCEALTGARPFEGATVRELLDAIARGPSPAWRRDVPQRVRRAVLRALSEQPERRFPSVGALVDELAHDPKRRVRQAMLAAPLLLGVMVGAAALGTRERPCAEPERHLAGTWDAAARAKLEAAFAKSGAAYSKEALAAFVPAVDAWAKQWANMHREACEATRLRGEQSENVLDLRMACLDEERRDLQVVVGALSDATPALVARAPTLASQLPPVASCADLELLRSQVPLPKDPAKRAAVIAMREKVTALRERSLKGNSKPLLAEVEALEPEVASLGNSRLSIELMRLRANMVSDLDPRAGPAQNHAQLEAALRAGDLHSAAYAWTALAYEAADGFEPYEKGLEYAALAEAALTRAPDYRIAARIRDARATILYQQGNAADAARAFEESVPLAERDFGPKSVDASTALNNAANVVASVNPERALELQQRSFAIRLELLGPSHPMSCTALVNLASRLRSVGRGDEAATRGREAVSCAERAFGPEHVRVANALGNLSAALRALGRWEEALEVSRRSIPIYEKTNGPEHRQTAAAHGDAAAALDGLGRTAEARDEYLKVVAILATCCAATPIPDRLTAHEHLATSATDQRERVAELEAALAEAERLKHPDAELATRREAVARAKKRSQPDSHP